MKKIIAILLILSFCFTLFACDNNEKTPDEDYILPTEVIDADISLPYTSADTLDPYASKSSMNRDLIPVIYESLYVSTEDGKGEMQLAVSGEENGNKLTVKIKSGVKFSDGVEVNSAYIKASFERAKSNPYYKANLANVTSIAVEDTYTVTFTLSRKDPFAFNVLTFPIIRISNGKYIGCGKYKLAYLEEMPYLQVNDLHRDYTSAWHKQIALYDMAGLSGPIYPFKANQISVYKNDLSKVKYINLSSATVYQNMNNLVYIGVNSKWAGSVASIAPVRQAMNIGISRVEIAAASFLGQSMPTITPFKDGFYQLKLEDLPSVQGEFQKAVSILERSGYNKFTDEGVRTNGTSSLRVNILVCTENEYKLSVAQAVKNSLQDIGFGVTITEKKTTEDFKAALDEGHFTLYIGETELPLNYDLTEFFSEKGALSYGIDSEFFKEYQAYEDGESSTMTFVESFETEVPFIPLFYRKAIVSVNPNIVGFEAEASYASVSDWKVIK